MRTEGLAFERRPWSYGRNVRNREYLKDSQSDANLIEEELQNEWLDFARSVRDRSVPTAQHNLYSRALCGVRAPIPDQLEVKGAWLTKKGHLEYVTADKRDRACQLFMFGFS